MSDTAPVTVGIPTYARGGKVLEPLARLLACTPPPAEIIVHVDASDGLLEKQIKEQFPSVRLLSSKTRVGPGGGRHRALHAATQPLFATFDDDSWPIDANYFARVVAHFEQAPDVALLESTIAHRGATAAPISDATETVVDYTGCGHALRVDAYRGITGYVDRPEAYGLEERDVALQLHAAGWRFMKCADLRVFHDTDLSHYNRSSFTAAVIENAALLPWLRYPMLLWPYGLLQYVNVIWYMLVGRRTAGIIRGVMRSPVEVWRHRHLRRPLSANKVWSYLRLRKR